MKKKTGIVAAIIVVIVIIVGYGIYAVLQKGEDLAFKNVVLISIDTLRADHVSCYGYTQLKTANIDSLAQDGVLFQNAFSQVPLTLPSHTSIMTGLFPNHHGVRNNGTFIFDKKSLTLAKIFASHAYNTAAFVSAYVLDRRFGLNDGFSHYDDDIPLEKQNPHSLEAERKAEAVTSKALQWLQQQKDNQFFMWIHYYDPHSPYAPPEPYASRYENPYDGEIAYVDDQIGVLLSYLKTSNLYTNTLIIIIGDHGEAFGEHKEMTHGMFLYDATLHVPFIIHFPHLNLRKRVTELVQSVDLFPTLLELIAAEKVANDGSSLIPLITGKGNDSTRYSYAETLYPNSFKWSALYSIRNEQWKYIEAPKSELYDISKDPEEKINVMNNYPEKAVSLQTRLKQAQENEKTSQTQFVEKETQEKLQALGYVSSYMKMDKNAKLPDPKDTIDYWLELRRAQYLLKNAPEEGIQILLALLQKDTYSAVYASTLSSYYQKNNEWDKAITYINEAIKRDDSNYYYWYDLAYSAAKKGELDLAEAAIQKSIALYKDNPEAYNLSGTLSIQAGFFDKAQEDFNKAVELDSKNSEALANLGNIYYAQKNLNKAMEYYKESLKYNPSNANSLNGLGVIVLQMKNYQEALQYFQQAVRGDPGFYECYLNIAIAYISLADYASARTYLEKILREATQPSQQNLHDLAAKLVKALPPD
jgi:choline-sulfatase